MRKPRGTLQVAFVILKGLERHDPIGCEALGADLGEWYSALQTLQEEGYIAGVEFTTDVLGDTFVDIEKARITMKGAEYLHENNAMLKLARAAGGAVKIAAEFIPKR